MNLPRRLQLFGLATAVAVGGLTAVAVPQAQAEPQAWHWACAIEYSGRSPVVWQIPVCWREPGIASY